MSPEILTFSNSNPNSNPNPKPNPNTTPYVHIFSKCLCRLIRTWVSCLTNIETNTYGESASSLAFGSLCTLDSSVPGGLSRMFSLHPAILLPSVSRELLGVCYIDIAAEDSDDMQLGGYVYDFFDYFITGSKPSSTVKSKSELERLRAFVEYLEQQSTMSTILIEFVVERDYPLLEKFSVIFNNAKDQICELTQAATTPSGEASNSNGNSNSNSNSTSPFTTPSTQQTKSTSNSNSVVNHQASHKVHDVKTLLGKKSVMEPLLYKLLMLFPTGREAFKPPLEFLLQITKGPVLNQNGEVSERNVYHMFKRKYTKFKPTQSMNHNLASLINTHKLKLFQKLSLSLGNDGGGDGDENNNNNNYDNDGGEKGFNGRYDEEVSERNTASEF